MLSRRRSQVPQDLQNVDRLLRDRPVLPEDRVQVISSRARARARASMFSTHHSKEPLLRSRFSILLMLVFGFAFSSAGVGMAVTGVTTDDQSAAAAQYGGPPPAPGTNPPVPGPTTNPPVPGGPGGVDEPPTPGGPGGVDEPPTLEPKGDSRKLPSRKPVSSPPSRVAENFRSPASLPFRCCCSASRS